MENGCADLAGNLPFPKCPFSTVWRTTCTIADIASNSGVDHHSGTVNGFCPFTTTYQGIFGLASCFLDQKTVKNYMWT